jgi:hypothetical protein
MKFRTIYILFNVVIVVSFLFVFLLPFFVLGPSYSLSFWQGNWYLGLFFVLLLGGLNAFFLLNWKLFVYVEREDWGALSAFLVDLIFTKRRYGNRHVALLVNAYLLQSDVEGIERLEVELAARRPELLRKNAVLFGVTRLLRNKPAEAEAFLSRYLDSRDSDDREWLRFDYAFSLVLQRRVAEALPHLRSGLSSRDAVLSLLSAYLVGSLGVSAVRSQGEKDELLALADASRASLKKRFPGPRWSREVERAKNEVHIVILSKLIDDAGRWLFEASATAAATAAAAGQAPDQAPAAAAPRR